MVCVRPSCASCPQRWPRSASGLWARFRTAIQWVFHLPQGPSLGFGLFCPGPSSLNRPHPPHSRAHRDFTAWRLIRDAFAVRERLGDPRVVPSFHCTFLPDMPSSPTPGSPTSTCPEFRCRYSLRRITTGSAPPVPPDSLSVGSVFSVASLVRFRSALPVSFPPCPDRTGPPHPWGLFSSSFSADRSPPPPLDMTTTVAGSPSVGGTLTRRNGS